MITTGLLADAKNRTILVNKEFQFKNIIEILDIENIENILRKTDSVLKKRNGH